MTSSPLAQARSITPAELHDMTPPQIDALNAAVGQEFDRLLHETDRAWESLYHAVGIRKEPLRSGSGRGYRQVWPIDRTELKARAFALLGGAPIDPDVLRHDYMLTTERGRADHDERIRTVLAEIDRHAAQVKELADGPVPVLAGEWTRRGGWSRFFLCLNADGHIHAGRPNGRQCKTVYPSTPLGWLPDLSGLTEADAVAAHGTVLCSVCFPTAPVEWTVGKAKPDDECPGSRTYADPKTYNPRRVSPMAPCPKGCGRKVTVTPNGYLRTHKIAAATRK